MAEQDVQLLDSVLYVTTAPNVAKRVSPELHSLAIPTKDIEDYKGCEDEDSKYLNSRLPVFQIFRCNFKYYLFSLLISIGGAVLCILSGVIMASVNWVTAEGIVYWLNTRQITLFFMYFCVSNAVGFVAVEFWSAWGFVRLLTERVYIVTIIGAVVSVSAFFLLYVSNFPYWYYYLDTLAIALVYVFGSCATGYLVCNRELNCREKIRAGVVFLGSELIVTGTTMIYGMFILAYYGMMSTVVKLAWRLTVHPIFFEFLVMVPARVIVKKKVSLRTSILSTLLIVHGHSHVYSLGRIMLANINVMALNVGATVALNIGKLVLRLSLNYRDECLAKAASVLKNAVFHNSPSSDTQPPLTTQECEDKAMIRAIGIISECIFENIAILSSPVLLYVFQTQKYFFSFPYEGLFTLEYAIMTISIQLSIGVVFDVFSIVLIESKCDLPIGHVWTLLLKEKIRYFGFLIYVMLSMGLTAVLYMTAQVPRFFFCTDPYNVCSCSTNVYCSQLQ